MRGVEKLKIEGTSKNSNPTLLLILQLCYPIPRRDWAVGEIGKKVASDKYLKGAPKNSI